MAERVEDIRGDVVAWKRSVEVSLDEGVGSWESVADLQLTLRQAIDLATAFGLDEELAALERLNGRLDLTACDIHLRQLLFELDHGEYPPEEEWRWTDYENAIARGRAYGLDVTRAEQALARARRVAASWNRGYDSPEHEEERRQRSGVTDPVGASARLALSEPSFPLAADASAQAIRSHFLRVEAAIPPRLTGTATAIELWEAIRKAHEDGALPLTGTWVDLISVLHRRGFLLHLPGEKASRAALGILADLSPFVRRLHRRRWMLGLER